MLRSYKGNVAAKRVRRWPPRGVSVGASAAISGASSNAICTVRAWHCRKVYRAGTGVPTGVCLGQRMRY